MLKLAYEAIKPERRHQDREAYNGWDNVMNQTPQYARKVNELGLLIGLVGGTSESMEGGKQYYRITSLQRGRKHHTMSTAWLGIPQTT